MSSPAQSACTPGSLSNQTVKARTKLIKEMILDTLKSFSLFITVTTIAKLNLEHSDNFEIMI